MTYLRAQVEIDGGSVGGKALMLQEPVRRDRIVTILPSGKVRPISISRPSYSFPHVGRKRISEEEGAARRGQLSLPRVSFPLSPQLIRSSQSNPTTWDAIAEFHVVVF